MTAALLLSIGSECIVHHNIVGVDAVIEVELDLLNNALKIRPINIAPIRCEYAKKLDDLHTPQ